jgi:hypothetical protein
MSENGAKCSANSRLILEEMDGGKIVQAWRTTALA